MADASNPTNRVLDVINLLAAHPTETFTLAEIARHVELSNGSAHRILTTMAEARFLSRNEKHKTYSLGIALVAVGHAAAEKHRGIEIARREIARLAAELNVHCSVTVVADDDLLLLAKEGTPQSHGGLHRVGERTPFVPPIGMGHIAWSDEQAIRTYLAKATDYMSEAMQQHLLTSISRIRARGYSIAADGPGLRKLRQIMILPIGHFRDKDYWSSAFNLIGQLSSQELQLLNLGDAGSAGIGYISAPVFSPAGTVSFEFVITGMPADLSTAKVELYAERLRAAAAVVTSEIHGRVPQI